MDRFIEMEKFSFFILINIFSSFRFSWIE